MEVILTNSYCRDWIRKNAKKEELEFEDFIKKYFSSNLNLCHKDRFIINNKPERIEIYWCKYKYLFCEDFNLIIEKWKSITKKYEKFIEHKDKNFINTLYNLIK